MSVLILMSTISAVLPMTATVADAAAKSGGIVRSKYCAEKATVIPTDVWVAEDGCKLSPAGTALRIHADHGSAVIKATPEDGIAVGQNREIGIYVRSLSDSPYTVTLTAIHGGGTSAVSEQITSGDEYYLFTSLGDNAGAITEITFSLSVPTGKVSDNSTVVSAMIGGVVLSTEDHSEVIGNYSAFDVDGIGKAGAVTSESPVVASPVIYGGAAGEHAARITLSGNGGGLTFHYSHDGESFGVYGSSVITEGRSTYIFPIGELGDEGAYKIEFTGTDKSDIILERVDFIPVPIFDTYDSLGTVTKCTVIDGSVTVTGSITRDSAVKYIDGEVCLYEIPMWQTAESVLVSEPAQSISMSTTFSFSLPISEDYSVFTSYVVAIKDKDGVYPLSDPIYPGSGYLAEAEEPFAAVSGLSPENAFSAGADKYIIDVDVAKLFLEKSGHESSVFTYDTYPYYPDKDVISQIRLKVQFLSAAGIDVLFRIDSGSRIFSAAKSDDCREIAAAVSYLTDQFKPYGFIQNLAEVNDLSASDYAKRSAAFARLISAVAGDSAAVFTSVDSAYGSESYVWLLANHLSDYPKADHRFIIPLPTEDDASVDVLATCASDGGYSPTFTFEADGGKALGESDADLDRYSVIVNVKEDLSLDISSDDTAFEVSRYEPNGDEITLWDFTNSYDSDGFTVPAGPTAVITETDELLEEHFGVAYCRCLKTVLGNDSHMIVARPKAPMNLSACNKVRFLMSCTSETAFGLDIVFISGDERAVFKAEYSGSGIYSPVCDLSLADIQGKIDRIAIVLRGGGPVELGIATVTAFGDGSLAEDAESLYITDTEIVTDALMPTDDSEDSFTVNKVYLAAGALVIVTIIIFAAMSIKKQ